jgi:hypothetical protein
LRKLSRLSPHLKHFEERSINGHVPPGRRPSASI